MRRAWLSLCLAAAVAGAVPAVAAEDAGAPGTGPSLEYRPPRPVLPEPKAPTPQPPISVFKESCGGYGISTGAFDGPADVAVDPAGNIYVLDVGNSRVQVFDSFSNFVLEWGSSGSGPGQFKRPSTIAIGPDGRIYIVDTGNHRVQIFGWVPRSECPNCPSRRDGTSLKFLSSWGSLGSRPGDFKDPVDIAFGGQNEIWILDAGNERVQGFNFKDSFEFATEFGSTVGNRGGVFSDQVSIAWSDERFGYLYLLGKGCVVQQFKPDGTLERTWSAVVPESGLCVPARIRSDNRDRFLYVLDSGNGLIARFHREGRYLSAVRGAERPFASPGGFALREGSDQFVVADTGNNLVQKFTLR
jgi:DNA-binding beta-propeller fold protein YncE